MRTALGVIAIGVQVAMVLTLVGVSEGMLQEQQRQKKGTGADILVRPPGSSIIGFSYDMPANIINLLRSFPDVAMATGTLVQPTGDISSVTGVDLEEFGRMSGGFKFLEGGPFRNPDDVIIDDVTARGKKLHVGDMYKNLLNRDWRVCGIVESGKLARVFLPIALLQDLGGKKDKVTWGFVKLKDPARTDQVIEALKARMPDYKIYSTEEFASLISIDNIPMLKTFIQVVIGLGLFVGFLVVFLSMYTAVLERTREIGILKALGASPGYILRILLAGNGLAGGDWVHYGHLVYLWNALDHEHLRALHDNGDCAGLVADCELHRHHRRADWRHLSGLESRQTGRHRGTGVRLI